MALRDSTTVNRSGLTVVNQSRLAIKAIAHAAAPPDQLDRIFEPCENNPDLKEAGKTMALREDIVQQAMNLPPADRAFVADALEQSLSSGGFATPEIAAAWATEIERRIAAYDRGDLPASNMETALENIRQHLASHRARKVNS